MNDTTTRARRVVRPTPERYTRLPGRAVWLVVHYHAHYVGATATKREALALAREFELLNYNDRGDNDVECGYTLAELRDYTAVAQVRAGSLVREDVEDWLDWREREVRSHWDNYDSEPPLDLFTDDEYMVRVMDGEDCEFAVERVLAVYRARWEA